MNAVGPHAEISAQQALGLSLALHELATNAIKYGALSVPEGNVEIEWLVPGLRPRWTELGKKLNRRWRLMTWSMSGPA